MANHLGATFVPGGFDDYYMPEVVAPAPQRCVPDPILPPPCPAALPCLLIPSAVIAMTLSRFARIPGERERNSVPPFHDPPPQLIRRPSLLQRLKPGWGHAC